ncbi:MAG: alpha/beta hydrolase [Vulcanimicrobiota bacterium]
MEIRPLRPVLARQAASGGPVEGARSNDEFRPGRPYEGGSLTGEFRVHTISSDVLGNTRDFYVYLPPSYGRDPGRRYRVLYLQDGQNVFDRRTAFMGREWGVDEVADELIRQGEIEELIIVGVSNTPARMDEYSQVADPDYGGGQADAYGHFLVDELKPYVDANYLTDTRPASTTLAGSSMGGLVSLFLAFQYPHVFGTAGALSPSLWWASGDLATRIAADRRPGPTKIWLDMGTAEGTSDTISPRPLDRDGKFGSPGPANGVKDVLDYTREMRQALLFRGYEEGRNLLYLEVPGGTHTEESWSARIGLFLKAVYGRG